MGGPCPMYKVGRLSDGRLLLLGGGLLGGGLLGGALLGGARALLGAASDRLSGDGGLAVVAGYLGVRSLEIHLLEALHARLKGG